jgi:hypothetical protein
MSICPGVVEGLLRVAGARRRKGMRMRMGIGKSLRQVGSAEPRLLSGDVGAVIGGVSNAPAGAGTMVEVLTAFPDSRLCRVALSFSLK